MTTKAEVLQAIRRKCLDCSCFQPGEVRECPLTTCGLWPFRLGRDPEPSRSRGFAKPRVYTGGFAEGAHNRGTPLPSRGGAAVHPPESLGSLSGPEVSA